MKAYHFTTSPKLERILRKGGLKPRGKSGARTSFGPNSIPWLVYFFRSVKDGLDMGAQLEGVVLEVDLKKRDLYPDEDSFQWILPKKGELLVLPDGSTIPNLGYFPGSSAVYQQAVKDNPQLWRESYKKHGTFATTQAVRANSILQVGRWSFKKRKMRWYTRKEFLARFEIGNTGHAGGAYNEIKLKKRTAMASAIIASLE